ncbi:MAG: hypothetical protein ACPGQL_02470 [Thermoplasmatota archaeon]
MRGTLLVVAVLLLAGCLGGPGQDDDRAPDAPPGFELSLVEAEMARTGADWLPVPPELLPDALDGLAVDAATWDEQRLRLSAYGDSWTSARLAVATLPNPLVVEAQGDPALGQGFLFVGVNLGPQVPSLLFPVALAPGDRTMITMDGTPPPGAEIAFFVGDDLEIILAGGPLADAAEAPVPVVLRPEVLGRDGFAGSYSVRFEEGAWQERTVGEIEVEKTGLPLEGFTATGAHPIGANGTAVVAAFAAPVAGVQTWNASFTLGDIQHEVEGTWARAAGLQPPVAVSVAGLQPASVVALAHVDEGPGSLSFTSQVIGSERGVGAGVLPGQETAGATVTWGWISARLDELYGWNWQDLLPAGAAS